MNKTIFLWISSYSETIFELRREILRVDCCLETIFTDELLCVKRWSQKFLLTAFEPLTSIYRFTLGRLLSMTKSLHFLNIDNLFSISSSGSSNEIETDICGMKSWLPGETFKSEFLRHFALKSLRIYLISLPIPSTIEAN